MDADIEKIISRFLEIQKNSWNISGVFQKEWLLLHPYSEEWAYNSEDQCEYKSGYIATYWESIYEIRSEKHEESRYQEWYESKGEKIHWSSKCPSDTTDDEIHQSEYYTYDDRSEVATDCYSWSDHRCYKYSKTRDEKFDNECHRKKDKKYKETCSLYTWVYIRKYFSYIFSRNTRDKHKIELSISENDGVVKERSNESYSGKITEKY